MSSVIDDPHDAVVRGLGDPSAYLLRAEDIIVAVRRHVLVLCPAFLETIGFILGAVMIDLLVSYVPIVSTLCSLLMFVAVVRFAYLLLEWRMERFVITDQRMILISGVLTRKVAVMPISKVTDLTFEKPLIGQIFNYGTFVVESAGQDQALSRIDFLPNANTLYLRVSVLLFTSAAEQQAPAEFVASPGPDTAPVVIGGGRSFDLDQTDPTLGIQLAGLDFDQLPELRAVVDDRFDVVPPERPAPSSRSTDEGSALRARLAGLNGRGRRRSVAAGPIEDFSVPPRHG